MSISDAIVETTKASMLDLLNRAFDGKLNFEPINVQRRVDHDGRDNMSIVVVFDGPDHLLEADKLNAVSVALVDVLDQYGFDNVPVESYIAKTEYTEWLRLNSQDAPWLETDDELATPL